MNAHRFASSPRGQVTTSTHKRHLLVPGLGILSLTILAVPLVLLANPAFAQSIDKSKTFFIETDAAALQTPMNLAGGTLKPTAATTFFQPVDITLPGSIIDNTNGNVVFSGNMSGAQGFTTQGGKSTILSGANTFTGNVFVNGGILQLGYGGVTGSIAAHVLLNGGDATFVINRSDTYNLDTKVTQNGGTGGFIQAGAGTTIVSSAITMNQKSGFGVAVQAGTLKVVSGGSVAASTISNNADFIVDVGGAVTADALTNSGKGVLTNSGYYTVTNTSNSGTLSNLNGGTITGNVDNRGAFNNNGTLSGNVVNSGIAVNDIKGTISGTVTNSGTFTNNGYVGGNIANAFQFTNAKTGTIKGLVTNGYEMRNYGVIETLKLTNNGTFVNYEGGVIKGDVVNSGRGFLNSGLVENGTILNTTNFANDKTGVINGAVTNSGIFLNDGLLSKGFINSATGIAYMSGQVLGNVSNAGFFYARGTLVGDGTFANAKGAVLGVEQNATYTGLTNLTNAGTINVMETGKLSAVTVSSSGTINNSGTLVAANVYLEKSGVLTGSGTIDGNLTAKSGSTIQPAAYIDSPYTQTKITGALLVEDGATINIRLAADGTGDGISAKSAKLDGGKLNLVMGPGTYDYGQRYTILTTTDGVSGTFSDVAYTLKLPALLVADMQYMKNDVVLRIRTNFQSVALNAVQAAAAKGLDEGSGFANTPKTRAFIDAILAQKPADLPRQFEQLSGEGLLSARSANRLAGSSFMGAISEAGSSMREGGIVSQAPVQVTSYAPYLGGSSPIKVRNPLATSNTLRVWGSFLTGKQNLTADASSGNGAQSSRLSGGVIGLDYQIASDWMIGIAGGMSESKFSGAIGKVTGDGKGAHVGVYSTAAGKDYYVQMSSAASFFNNKTERSIIGVGALPDENASASYNSLEWRSRVEVGLDEYVGDVKFTPYMAAEVALTRNPQYAETSKNNSGTPGIMALTFAGDTSLSLPVSLGLKMEKRMEFNGGFSITPTMSVAYVHDFRGQQQQKTSYSVLPGSSFTVLGAKAPDSIQAKLGIQIGLGKHLALYAQAEGEISRNARAYAGRVGVKGMW